MNLIKKIPWKLLDTVGSGQEHPELEFAEDWKTVLEKCHCMSDLFLNSSRQLGVATVRNTILGWMAFDLTC